MKILSIIFKITIAFVGVLLLLWLLLFFRYHESIPEGYQGESCHRVIDRMFGAMNQKAWEQTRYVVWHHRGKTKYLWDKKEHHVRVTWSNYEVFLKPSEKDGIVLKNNIVIGDDGQIIETAYKKFINDAFWLCAPMHIKSTNIDLSCVDLNLDQDGLMANYISGGVTPGDTFLWYVNQDGFPTRWKMWVSLFPVGGVDFHISDWVQLSSGAWLPTKHRSMVFDVNIEDLADYASYEEMGLDQDPFHIIKQ